MIGVEEEAKKGLSGWAIFGIVAGCLAVVGITVLVVVLVKKKGSYKSNWNFQKLALTKKYLFLAQIVEINFV